MGVEVVASEMSQLPAVDNGLKHGEENGKSDKVYQPIKFGSHGEESVKVEAIVDDNVPKNAAFEWPAPKAVHSFYFVRYRSYEDPKKRAKMDQAEKELQKKNQARSQLIEELRAKKSDRAELIDQLRPLKAEARQYKMILDEKKREIGPLRHALGKIRTTGDAGRNGGICSSEKELNDLIRSLQYRIQHETILLPEEKQILREIRQLEGTRKEVVANSEMREKIQDSLGQKDVIQDQVKLMGADLDEVRKENQNVWIKINKIEEKLDVVDREIKGLQEELTALIQKRDKAFGIIQDLRKQRDEDNTFFKQSREVVAQAKLLAVSDGEKRKEAIVELAQLSRKEVDNFIALYSKDKSFRDDYQRRLLSSLDMRQMSRDGRIRNPDEKPIIVVEVASEPEVVAKGPVKRAKEEPKSSPQEDTVNQKVALSKSKVENVGDSDDDTFAVEKPQKDAAKDEEVDEAKLKEMKREEEIAKAKLAMERKKKMAEKAAAKASLRAQKEAEKKLKEREKKAKKKAAASGTSPQLEDPAESSLDSSEPEKEDEPSPPLKEKALKKEITVRYRNRAARTPELVPKAILKRKRSNNLYWMLAAPTALAVLILLVFGFYNFL